VLDRVAQPLQAGIRMLRFVRVGLVRSDLSHG
jgi:hypothetical protein